jgi:predicted HAD superfamily hydrolase
MKHKVISFDVFETAIVRIWAKPTHLFWELGNNLKQEELIQISPQSWQQMRIEAEQTARKKSLTGEVSIEDIYQQLALLLGWSSEQVKKVIQKEIALEISSLRPVPANQRKIKALQEKNARIIYMSDMYLSEATIENFLIQNNVWATGSKLYVSSKVGISKATGKLFRHCLKQESVNPSEMLHIGDNLHADVKKPKRQGVKVEPFTQTHLNRYEQIIAEEPNLPLRFRSLLAGMSRLTRLQSQQSTSHKQVIWDTTASAIAPVLFGFVHSCLQKAQEKGIKRLYFVARDGQILHKIAEVICRNWHYDIDCRYLYGSRQAWNAPALQEIGETELSWIFSNTTFLSVDAVCERVNIKPKQIQDILNRHGFATAKWNLNLNSHERERLKRVFIEKEVVDIILATATTYREKAIGYFRQEQLDGLPFAIVDVGWTGSSLRSFSKVLQSAGFYPQSGTHGFFFALEKRLKASAKDQLLAYFYDAEAPVGNRSNICQYRCLFELFVSADHGGTKEYDRNGDKYFPVLRYEKNEVAINWGLYVLHEAAVEFANQFTSNLTPQECSVDLFLKATDILMEEFVNNPSTKEAKTFGSFLMAEDQGEKTLYELAPAYTFIDCIKLITRGRHPHENIWLSASLARTNPILRIFLNEKAVSSTHNIRVIGSRLRHSIFSKPISNPF